MKRNLTCIVCPMGCNIEVELENGEVLSVTGNTCKRGEEYAKNECISPVRTITSTVRCEDGGVVPVKTDRPIPKDKMFECIRIIKNRIFPLPICAGDVIISDIFGSNIIATADRGKNS